MTGLAKHWPKAQETLFSGIQIVGSHNIKKTNDTNFFVIAINKKKRGGSKI